MRRFWQFADVLIFAYFAVLFVSAINAPDHITYFDLGLLSQHVYALTLPGAVYLLLGFTAAIKFRGFKSAPFILAFSLALYDLTAGLIVGPYLTWRWQYVFAISVLYLVLFLAPRTIGFHYNLKSPWIYRFMLIFSIWMAVIFPPIYIYYPDLQFNIYLAAEPILLTLSLITADSILVLKTKTRWQEAQEAESKYFTSMLKTKPTDRPSLDAFPIDKELLEDRVLEIGCTQYGVIHALPDGIGIDPLALKYSQSYPRGEHFAAVAESIPFKDHSFKVVTCLNTIDHVINQKFALEEMKRVMNERGFLLLSVNVFSAPRFIRNSLGKFDKPHPVHFSESEVSELLMNEGLMILSKTREKKPFSYGLRVGSTKSAMKTWIATLIFGMNCVSFTCQNGGRGISK